MAAQESALSHLHILMRGACVGDLHVNRVAKPCSLFMVSDCPAFLSIESNKASVWTHDV